MPFEFLSDAHLALTRVLRLPTFEFPVESGGPTTLLARMAWYCDHAVIEHIWYPVFPPNENAMNVLRWLEGNAETLENSIKSALDKYSASHAVGAWARSVVGVGPVICAGLLAHIDITKAPTAGHIWNYAGLNPSVSWEKGQKRPWNAALKTLCWKLGEEAVRHWHEVDAGFAGRQPLPATA